MSRPSYYENLRALHAAQDIVDAPGARNRDSFRWEELVAEEHMLQRCVEEAKEAERAKNQEETQRKKVRADVIREAIILAKGTLEGLK